MSDAEKHPRHVLCPACGHMGCEHLAAELLHLRAQRDDLQGRNTDLVGQRRAIAAALVASQAEVSDATREALLADLNNALRRAAQSHPSDPDIGEARVCAIKLRGPASSPPAARPSDAGTGRANCPGPECPYCSGEACRTCGPDLGTDVTLGKRLPCEHDAVDRHRAPTTEKTP